MNKTINPSGIDMKTLCKGIVITLILVGVATYLTVLFAPQMAIGAPVIPPKADLGILHLDNPDPVQVLHHLIYTINITNYGPEEASNVSITDQLSDNVMFHSSNPPPSSHIGALYCWEIESLVLNGSYEIILDVTVNSSAAETTITNTVNVTSSSYDPNSSNNGKFQETTVNSINPNITIIKNANTSSANIGDPITYTYIVINSGDVFLSDVYVVDDTFGSVPLGASELAPGQNTSGQLTYTIVESDFPGPIENFATVFGYYGIGYGLNSTTMESVSVVSDPPNTPSDSYPNDGETQVQIHSYLGWNCSDPDGDPLTYDVYFGESYPPSLKIHNQSIDSYDFSLSYDTTYYWRIIAWDNHGESTSSGIWEFKTEINNPPSIPTIFGPTTGQKNTTYEFTAFSTDADNHNIRYTFDWGDNGTSTTAFLSSGALTSQTHTWENHGVYTITVKAFDGNAESEINNHTILIDVLPIDGEIQGYLVDEDSDGTFDFFDNIVTSIQTAVAMENNTYLIDSDGDGIWDHVYNQETGLSTYYEYVYHKYKLIFDSEMQYTPGFEALPLMLSLLLVIIILGRRRQS